MCVCVRVYKNTRMNHSCTYKHSVNPARND